MKKIIIISIILIFFANGCDKVFSIKNEKEETKMEDFSEQSDVVMACAEENTKKIMEKSNNNVSCGNIEDVYQYDNIPGYNVFQSALPMLGSVNPNKIECIRMSENKEYVYAVYKVKHEDVIRWAFRFYKLNDGVYIGDSILFTNDKEKLSWILNYTMDDLLDIDKDFIKNLQ